MFHGFSFGDDPGTKRFQDGTHRLIPPSETLSKVTPLLPAMGITRIANVTGLDRIGVPVIMVTRPNARSIAVSQGKGLDLDAAKASGVMEAIEIHHAEHIQHPLKLASHNEMMSSHDLIDLDRLAKVANSRFHPDLPMLWIEGFDLLNSAPLWLPYETVHTNFTLPSPPGAGSFSPSTNGLASGNHILEATCHALFEIIERDAITLWRSCDDLVNLKRLDLDTVSDPGCREVLQRLDDAELDLAAFDATSDLGMPVFYATLIDRRHEASHPGIGAGCHIAPEVALLRAMTETIQVRMTYITGARDDLSPEEFTERGRSQKLGPVNALMRRDGQRPSFNDIASPPIGATFADDLALILERLRAVGIEQAAVVDLTKPAFDVAVVKAVIPGLEDADDHDGYVPGPRALAVRVVT
jgi:ribosomal protein S12 methylthiotransferase accessory factor